MSQRPCPTCWLCKKPVDKLIHEQNARDLTFHFVAECHGEKEYVKIDCLDWSDRVTMGYAFKHTTKKLEDKND